MLESVTLKFTQDPQQLAIPAAGVTIFVGPNNSGKSLVLRELEQALSTNDRLAAKILSDFEILWPSPEQLEKDIEAVSKRTSDNLNSPGPNDILVGRYLPGGGFDNTTHNKDELRNQHKQRNKHWFASQFLRFFMIRLDGRTRFNLLNDQERGHLLKRPENMFAHLYREKELRKQIRTIVYDAFKIYPTLDAMNGSKLTMRLSPTEPVDSIEQSPHSRGSRVFCQGSGGAGS